MNKKWILYIGLIIGVATYLFWQYLPKGYFYKGNALFVLSICTYLFVTDTKSFIKYVLFCLSINNLIDELFLDPTKLNWSEILTCLAIIGFAIKRNNAKKPPVL